MNEKFVATNRFILLKHLHNFIFKSPSTQQIPVIIIIMDTILHSHQRWNGWMDTKTRVDKQTYRKADRINPWTIYQ